MKQSGWTAAVADIQILNKNRTQFDDGTDLQANRERFEPYLKNGSLEKAYRAGGIKAVMKLTGYKKTIAYKIVAYAGLNRSVYPEKVAQQIAESIAAKEAARQAHCLRTYFWMPRQEYCTLNGKSYSYEGSITVGGLVIPGGKPFFMASIPGKTVLEYMISNGLKYFIVDRRVISLEEAAGCKKLVVFP